MATGNIRNIAFDLGGVVLALSYENAIKKFEEIGLLDASSMVYLAILRVARYPLKFSAMNWARLSAGNLRWMSVIMHGTDM